jgi:DNA-binding transcriptional LysR family regulator
MELQQLHHLVVIARTGSVARAAEELNLTQSGLSRSIKTLEESVGLPLFNRQARGVTLTPYGRALVGRATLIWNERALAVAELRDMKAMRAGRVELGLHSVFNYAFGSDVLGAFATRHPLVNLSVWSGAGAELTRRLVAGELEFAFTLQDLGPTDPELAFEMLAELECAIFVRQDHPLAGRSGLGIEDLAEASWALCGVTGSQRTFEALFQAAGAHPPVRLMETTSIALLVSAMLTRDLVTILPSFLVRGDILKGRLVALDVRDKPPSVAAGLLSRHEIARTPATEALSQIFRTRAAQLSGSETA